MRPVARFVFLLAGCTVLAVVLSPWLYMGVQAMAAAKVPFAAYLARHPFHRYFNRMFQVSMGVTLPFLLYRSGFLSFKALGLRSSQACRELAFGAGSSLMIFALYGATLLLAGLYDRLSFYSGIPWGWIFGRIFLTSVLVAFFEELFFRGYLYPLFKQSMPRALAIGINAVFFAIVHYIKPERSEDLDSVHWDSGFRMLGLAAEHLSHLSEMIGGIVVLITIASMLCWSLDRTRSLYVAIGLHAGWIFALQWHAEAMRPHVSWPVWVLGGGDLSQGVIAVLPLFLQWLLLNKWLPRKHPFSA